MPKFKFKPKDFESVIPDFHGLPAAMESNKELRFFVAVKANELLDAERIKCRKVVHKCRTQYECKHDSWYFNHTNPTHTAIIFDMDGEE